MIGQLVPCYACFAFASLFAAVLYGLGRTDLLFWRAIVGNAILVILFTLFSNGVLFESSVFAVAAIFGVGLVVGTLSNAVLIVFIRRKNRYL